MMRTGHSISIRWTETSIFTALSCWLLLQCPGPSIGGWAFYMPRSGSTSRLARALPLGKSHVTMMSLIRISCLAYWV